jgi:dienelactone hydrolase
MTARLRLSPGRFLIVAMLIGASVTIAPAQISTGIIERHRAELQKQASDPEMKRERGTIAQDWPFTLPAEVVSRQITFYSEGTRCYGRIFFPKGFSTRGRWPAVVVGHGINAQAVGIEKYAATFAERGLVAMAIDYRTYGYSGGDVMLLEPDTTTDERVVWEKQARLQIKRTNLINFRETEDFRAAVSYLQGEPGIDPERIGVWGSSNGASVVLMAAALDSRIKAVVAQVGSVGGLGSTGPAAIAPQMLEDGIRRARTGQGAEVDGGFSFRSKIDMWSNQVNREFRPGMLLDRIPETTKILWIPVEKDELIPPRGVQAATKAFRGISQVIEVPYLTHFQIYSYAGFEVSSTLAADWFLKYLGRESEASGAVPGKGKPAARLLPVTQRVSAGQWRPVAGVTLPEGVSTKEIYFYSEGIRCSGRIFMPKGFSAESKAPAVVLAPDWGATAGSIEKYAATFAGRGLVAMVIDYRGWGRSGGFLETVDQVMTDDRLRFSQLTARVRIRRKRLNPQHQILDIRNALYFLQGEPGVDRARVGVWGVGMAGGHAIVIAATDARIKAAIAQAPVIAGRETPKRASAPSGALLQAELKRARTGSILSDQETRLALFEYHPFWYVDQIPQTTAIMFVIAKKGSKAQESALAASTLLKGPIRVVTIPGNGADLKAEANAAADFFLKHLSGASESRSTQTQTQNSIVQSMSNY